MRIACNPWTLIACALIISACWLGAPVHAQRMQFPETPSGLRPIQSGQPLAAGGPTMVPINPATQAGIYPSTGAGGATFDPYSVSQPQLQVFQPPQGTVAPGALAPGATNYPGAVPNYPNNPSMGGYPTYNGISPGLPGAGQSGTVGTFQNTSPGYNQPGMYPNSSPSARRVAALFLAIFTMASSAVRLVDTAAAMDSPPTR